MQIRALSTDGELERYASFGHEVYRENPYWVPPDTHHLVSMLSGQTAYGERARA